MIINSQTEDQAVLWNKFLYLGAIFIPISFYHFILIFIDKEKERKVILTLGYVIAFVFLYFNFFSRLFIEGAPPIAGFNYWLKGGPVYNFFFAYFLVLVLLIFFEILFSYKQLNTFKKRQFLYITLAAFFGFVGGITDFFPQLFNIYPFGNYLVILYLGVISYSILKYQLFNLKTIATELFTIVLLIILIIRFILAKDPTEKLISGILIVPVLIFGILLIRSVLKEVEQREHIEKLAKQLEHANGKLKELDQLKSEFLSLATHQLRAPLTAIKGYSSMLMEGDFGVLPQKAKDSVKTINTSCQNLINIVEDFLNISRIEQGRMVYNKSIFDMRELVEEVANEIKPNIDNAGLYFQLDAPTNASAEVLADKGKMKQVVGNVIDNAIKYTIKGGIRISVSIKDSLYTPQKWVLVSVKDTGIGLDPEDITKLFAKFSRARDARKQNIHGTGLGLYIAKKMAESHGGDIKVTSEGLGKGSTFTIELPLHTVVKTQEKTYAHHGQS